MSAASGAGVDLLLGALGDTLGADSVRETVVLPPEAGRLRARLYESGHIMREESLEDGSWLLEFEVPAPEYERLRRDHQLDSFLRHAAPLAGSG